MTEQAPASSVPANDKLAPPVHSFPQLVPGPVVPVAIARLPKVYVALCTRDWQSEAHTTESVRNIGRSCKAEITVRYMMNDGVARARNNLAAGFLESDCDILFFLDNDIIIEPRHFDRLVGAIMQRKIGIICGLYPKKQATLDWVINQLPGEVPDAEGFQKVKHAGTGCMAISREMLKDFIAKHPEIAYGGDPSPESKRWDLFPMRAINGSYKSEDWAFCEMAREAGWDVWIDTKCQLRHVGKIVFPLQFTLTDEEVVDLVMHRYNIHPDLVRTFIGSGSKPPGLMGGHREVSVRHWPREFPVGDLHHGEVLAGCYDMPYYVEGKEFSIIDIGADVGGFARWAAKRWPKCPIHCYEWRPNLLPSLQVTANAIFDRHGVKPTIYAGKVEPSGVEALPVARVIKIDAPGEERDLVSALATTGRAADFDCIMLKYADELTAYFIGTILAKTHIKHCQQRYTENTGILKFLRRANTP